MAWEQSRLRYTGRERERENDEGWIKNKRECHRYISDILPKRDTYAVWYILYLYLYLFEHQVIYILLEYDENIIHMHINIYLTWTCAQKIQNDTILVNVS